MRDFKYQPSNKLPSRKTNPVFLLAVIFTVGGLGSLPIGEAGGSLAFNKPLEGHKKSVNAVRFTPDGKYVFSGSDDHTARLWNFKTGQEVRRIEYSLPIFDVAFSPDGKVAFTSTVSALPIWDFETFKALRGVNTDGHANWGYHLTIPDGERILAVATDDDKCYINVIEWKKEPDPHKGGIWTMIPGAYYAAFTPNGKQLACGDDFGKIQLWTIAGAPNRLFFYGHKAGIRRLTFSKDGKLLLSGAMDKTARLWKLENGEELQLFQGHSGWVTAVAISPDCSLGLTGSSDYTVRLWDLKSGKEICCFEGHTDLVTSVDFSPDGKAAVSGSDDGTVRLWDVAARTSVLNPQKPKVTVGLLKRVEGYTDWIADAIISEDAQCVLFRNKQGKVTLWDVTKDQAVSHLGIHNGIQPVLVNSHGDAIWALSHKKDKLLAYGSDHQLRLWDINKGVSLRNFPIPPATNKFLNTASAVALSADGKLALAGFQGGWLHLFDTATGQKIRSFYQHIDAVRAIQFSGDGELAVVGTGAIGKTEQHNTVRILEIQTGKEIYRFQGHKDVVNTVAISPDKRYVLSGSWDKTINLWDIETKKKVHNVLSPDRFIPRRLLFSPDGKSAMACGSFGVKLWEIPSGKNMVTFKKPRTGEFTSVAFSPNGSQGVSISRDRVIRVWILPKSL